MIAGYPVYRLPSAKKSVVYLVPKLGVRIGAHGPQARQILSTLRQSPLGAVLASGPAGRVPASWERHDFGGVKFASPRGWHTEHENVWETCGTGVDPRSLALINAKKPPIALPCPFPLPFAKALAAVPGLTVVTGKFAAQSVAESYRHCLARDGARICLSTEAWRRRLPRRGAEPLGVQAAPPREDIHPAGDVGDGSTSPRDLRLDPHSLSQQSVV